MISIKSVLSLDFYRLKKLRRKVDKINNLSSIMSSLTDQELKNKTAEFKERLNAGETLDKLLTEAYAVVREVDRRVLGKYPYDVQVLGAIILHDGNIAEMKTGEGKTLTATMPVYLNALTGDGVLVITTSGYLAKRDFEEMKPVYEFLGLSVSCSVLTKEEEKTMDKKKIYDADIVYTTNTILGYDYLLDNLVNSADKKFLRPLNYAVIDEVDSVLLDTAQTPLIISGAPRVQSNLYDISNRFIKMLAEGVDYYYKGEDNELYITQQGIDEAEKFFALENLYDISYFEMVRHLNLALRAHKFYENGKEYVVEDDKVQLLDATNGRIMEGTKLQGGQHQAIEAKEGVPLTPEMRAIASVTYQSLFLMFKKLSGMTGTGKPAESEFIDTYNMEVICVPTNVPVQRIDLPDKIYTTLPEKLVASIEYIKALYDKKQPMLIVAGSVRMSELYSEMLLLEGIPHNLLNAFNEAKEAQMIAEAGQLGNVTVATNMAGRGTDIKISEEVRQLGGLAVIGTERMTNKRMDLQLRGRSGRQGDPGFSQFFVSLEDDLVTKNGEEWVQRYFKKQNKSIDESLPRELTKKRFRRMLDAAQSNSESSGKSARAATQQFDKSLQIQRDYVYNERNALLQHKSEGFDMPTIIEEFLLHFVNSTHPLNKFTVERFILDYLSHEFNGLPKNRDFSEPEVVKSYLTEFIEDILEEKRVKLADDYSRLEQLSVLKAIDEMWIEEVDYLQQLKMVISGRISAQRNPIFEYHKEALKSYEKMISDIKQLSVSYLVMSEVFYNEEGKLEIHFA